LYGFISLSKNEIRLIDTKAFRRLLSIKQLSHAFVVYPSAVHTRFEHSLGALHVAGRICSRLGLDKERSELIRLTMLLHDIGHGPFSHLFEEVLKRINGKKIEHELISTWMINEDSEISDIVRGQKKEIIKLLLKDETVKDWETSGRSLNSDIISSGIDADKLDYLRRDSYHIGVAYGQFDLERILHTLKITPSKARICIDEKGKDAVENYRLGRYLMHAQVYEHHTRIVAEQMFLKALDLAVKEKIINKKDLVVSNSSSHKKFLETFMALDDRNLYDTILAKSTSDSAKILRNIAERKLLKRACEIHLNDIKDVEKGNKITKTEGKEEEIAKEIAKEAKVDPLEVIVKLTTITIKLYDKKEILVLWKKQTRDLNEMSPISAESSIVKFHVFGPRDKDKLHKVSMAVSKIFGLSLKQIVVDS
jgi:hypothetical protein